MTIPLDRLRDFELTPPGPGEISIAVARHEAAVWPSPEVFAYAQHRAQLIHELVEDTDVRVVSWGETDGNEPREVVEVIVAVAPAVISSVAAFLAAWVSRPRRAQRETEADAPMRPQVAESPLPGIRIRRNTGDELHITYRDGLSNKEILGLVKTFLDEAVAA
jgi:hypothetical protein